VIGSSRLAALEQLDRDREAVAIADLLTARSDKPSTRCNTITVATIIGGTHRRPTSVNKSANNESGNNPNPSRCNTE